MKRLLPTLAGASVIALGLFWSFAGISKMVDLAMPATRETGQWIDQFPAWLIVTGAAAEVVAGAAILTGRRLAGLVLGALLLSAFTVLLVVRPPAPGQSCGCLGSAANTGMLATMDPLLRNGFLGTLHVLALASVLPPPRVREPRPASAAA